MHGMHASARGNMGKFRELKLRDQRTGGPQCVRFISVIDPFNLATATQSTQSHASMRAGIASVAYVRRCHVRDADVADDDPPKPQYRA